MKSLLLNKLAKNTLLLLMVGVIIIGCEKKSPQPTPTLSYADTTITSGVAITLNPTETNFPSGDRTYVLTTTPEQNSISIHPSTGSITIPDSVAIGKYTLKVTVTMDGYDAIISNEIIINVIRLPTLSYTSDTTITSGVEIILSSTEANFPSGDKTYDFTNSPTDAGITIDNAGIITIGENVAVGEYTLKVTVTMDGYDAIISNEIIINVIRLPTLSYTADTTIRSGVAITLNPTEANFPSGDKTYDFTNSPTDAGITIDNAGIITIGENVAIGEYTLKVTVTMDGYDAIISNEIIVRTRALTGKEIDKDILMIFYNGLTAGKENLTDWGSEKPIGEWKGVTINNDGRVIILNLFRNELAGIIPSELGNLTNLTELNLRLNKLAGIIPSELGNLTELTSLNLSENRKLVGSIPSELGKLINLTELNLFTNSNLEGSIPSELGDLTELTSLNLSDNRNLTGGIPSELGKLTNLTSLKLSNTNIGGSIPSELGGLTKLTNLDLSTNNLEGIIPSELGNLTNLTELRLDWSGNLTGGIPSELGKLTNLTILNLAGGMLEGGLGGIIPPELGNLTNLTELVILGNELEGSIPSELGNLTKLIILQLESNNLSGNIPAALGSLTKLETLKLEDNDLSGEIPTELGKLTKLQTLRLENNGLSGEIPSALGNLTELSFLMLNNNTGLTGPLPGHWCGVIFKDIADTGLTCD